MRDDVLRAARSKLKTFNANRARDDRIFVNEDLVDNSRKLLSSARAEVQAKNILVRGPRTVV
jgi:hypothetical protein